MAEPASWANGGGRTPFAISDAMGRRHRSLWTLSFMSPSNRKRRLLSAVAVGAVLACGAATVGLLTREPTLEGRTVLSWLREYESECCFSSGNEAWGVFHRSGSNAVAGLVR